ncbi:MAG: UvrD-helicase domain-containing protein, partial [Oscillospiraceae bacterium]|nr:UvrD-helicase domain-containing protein [Oscillospiraceae bacterium]
DELCAALAEVPFERFVPDKTVDPGAWGEIKTLRDEGKKLVENARKGVFSVDGATLTSDAEKTAADVRALLRLTGSYRAAWQKKKTEAGLVSFDDMEHLVLALLSRRDGDGTLVPSDFAREYGSRIREIMVDEYQDTNAVQDRIFTLLAAGGARLFVVGDVKQSIYRFRKAEPRIFLSRRRRGGAPKLCADAESEREFPDEYNTVVMRRNFRSAAGVTDAVNAVFRRLMTEPFGEMEYGPEDELISARGPLAADGGEAELDLIDADAGEEDGPDVSAREREARWIARRVETLLASGRTVEEKGGAVRPLRPDDVAVLMRSAAGGRMELVARALAERGIPVNTDACGDVFASAEVNAVMSLLAAVDNPGRDIPFLGYLRSPLAGFTADELGLLRAEGKPGVYAAVCAAAEEETALGRKCRALLAGLRRMRLAAADTDAASAVGTLLDESRAFVVFGSMEGGAERRANLTLLLGLAAAYTERGGRDLGGFVRSLERSRERGTEFSAPKSGAAGVRLMTVHASKGLEFPVVILANSMDRINADWKRANVLIHRETGVGMMAVDREAFTKRSTLPREAAAELLEAEQFAEELRLLYVAMTRARDKLIVTGVCRDPDKLRREVRTDGSPERMRAVCRAKPFLGAWLLAAA